MGRHIEALYEVQKRARRKSYQQLRREIGADVGLILDMGETLLEEDYRTEQLPIGNPAVVDYDGPAAQTALVLRLPEVKHG